MSRRVQHIQIPKGGCIAIETPEGIVELRCEGGRRFRIDLPEQMVAHRSTEAAMRDGRFLSRSDDGRMSPKYDALLPVLNGEGEIASVQVTQIIKSA